MYSVKNKMNLKQLVKTATAIALLTSGSLFASDDYEDELLNSAPHHAEQVQYKMLGTIGFMNDGCATTLRHAIEDAEARDDSDAAAEALAGFDPTTATATEKVLHTAYSKTLNQGTNLVAMVYTFDQAAAPVGTTLATAAANPGKMIQCGRDVSVGNVFEGFSNGNVAQATSGAVNSVAILIGVSNAVASVGSGLSFAQSGKTFQVPQWIDDAAAAAFRNIRPQPATASAVAAEITEAIAIPVATFAPRNAIAPITHVAMVSPNGDGGIDETTGLYKPSDVRWLFDFRRAPTETWGSWVMLSMVRGTLIALSIGGVYGFVQFLINPDARNGGSGVGTRFGPMPEMNTDTGPNRQIPANFTKPDNGTKGNGDDILGNDQDHQQDDEN